MVLARDRSITSGLRSSQRVDLKKYEYIVAQTYKGQQSAIVLAESRYSNVVSSL
jgi:hypothetical protein